MENPFEEIVARLERMEIWLERIESFFTGGNTQETDEFQWYSLEELVKYLPTHPAKPTVYSWIHTNQIPHSKRGKRLYFKKSEIDEWLQSGRCKTMAEIQKDAAD
jgi:excisionase family DNA binding protein